MVVHHREKESLTSLLFLRNTDCVYLPCLNVYVNNKQQLTQAAWQHSSSSFLLGDSSLDLIFWGEAGAGTSCGGRHPLFQPATSGLFRGDLLAENQQPCPHLTALLVPIWVIFIILYYIHIYLIIIHTLHPHSPFHCAFTFCTFSFLHQSVLVSEIPKDSW